LGGEPALTRATVSEIEELKKESEALRKIRDSIGTEGFPQMVFDKVFNTDIHRLLSNEDTWKNRRPPEPLEFATVMARAKEAGLDAAREQVLRAGQKPWSLEQNLIVFIDSLERLSKRMHEMKAAAAREGGANAPDPIITFDKDDEDTLDFVSASANIRSTLFGIERQSRFNIKQMAGNIIPAIATTNAIVAALCVLEGYKILRGEYDKIKEVSLGWRGAGVPGGSGPATRASADAP
jgi:ubiquitin-like 1-activating enzyme E1 B